MIAVVEMLREQLAWERSERERELAWERDEKEKLRQKLEAAHEEIGALKWELQQRVRVA